ncbi:MAG: rRNA (guanine527-N7)-methyltransferase [Pseudonocardiales bacterium]|jgi:16S rRNA (guanine527-N7)-methyltransferase|nr:rRNA (guanine527-N7)-methyltransferase [Pseudonocardiales bacterium]
MPHERSLFHVKQPMPPDVHGAAQTVFGERYPLAERYATLLASSGVDRGLIGPREGDRLWERHLLNSAVLAELVPRSCRVLDVGSGAGLPGIPLALARPDLSIVLLEPMARRVAWLREVVAALGLAVEVHRGRAEDPVIRNELGGNDVVTARAVAPLGRLASWSLPLVAPGGRLLAIKGAGADEEASRDVVAVRAAGGAAVEIVRCGVNIVHPPTTVIVVRRLSQRVRPSAKARKRKDR